MTPPPIFIRIKYPVLLHADMDTVNNRAYLSSLCADELDVQLINH